MRAVLMLEDGYSLDGEAVGAFGEKVAELILNTASVGYQEVITDPANVDKIVVFTYPLIGNYGVASKFNESKQAWVSAVVIKDLSRIHSNWQAQAGMDSFIKQHNLFVLSGVDTRILAVHLRENGQMLGIVSTECFEPEKLLAKIKQFKRQAKPSRLPEISVTQARFTGKKKARAKLAVLDLGVTAGLINQLGALGTRSEIFAYDTAPEVILRSKPSGVIVSSGPEEDPGLETVVDCVRRMLGVVPLLGVSTGALVLARALGGKIFKMKLGHHGHNYPVITAGYAQGRITAQNHSYAIDPGSLSAIKSLKVSAQNLNDGTIEQIESKKLKLLGVQYCLLSPGFDLPHPVLEKFLTVYCGKSVSECGSSKMLPAAKSAL